MVKPTGLKARSCWPFMQFWLSRFTLCRNRAFANISGASQVLQEGFGRFRVDKLTAFGLFAVAAMVLCYALEDRNRQWTLGFAFSCLLGSTYGFLQGAWPFGVVEIVWAGIAVRRWLSQRRDERPANH